jgi:hypothetical protein
MKDPLTPRNDQPERGGVGVGRHLRAYPRLKGPGLEADAPGSSPDNPILPPDGTRGLLMLCYGEDGWVLIPQTA